MSVMSTNKLNQYNEIIKTLQRNDHNSTYDDILEDYNNDLNEAIRVLKEVLERLVFDEDLEGEELEFYKTQLNKVNNLQSIIN